MRQNTSDKNPECPAIKELADTLEACFRSTTLLTTNNVSPGTRHTAGLAIDIMLDVTRVEQRRLAHGIIDVLVAHHSSMQWSDLIYSDFEGGAISYFHIPARGGFGGPNGMLKRNPYTADTRHGDHIHLDWVDLALKNTGAEYSRIPYKWSGAAETVGFAAELTEAFHALASGQAAPRSEEAVPAWLMGWWEVTWRGEAYFYFFERSGQVRWTDLRHTGATQPPQNARDRGAFAVSEDNVTIRWGASGSVETFGRRVTSKEQMRGTWNYREPLVAEKL